MFGRVVVFQMVLHRAYCMFKHELGSQIFRVKNSLIGLKETRAGEELCSQVTF